MDQLLTFTRLQKLNIWRRTQFGPKDHLHQDPATLGDGTSWCIRYVTGSRFHSKFRNPDAHPMALILPFVTFAGFKISYLSCSRLWGRKPVWFLKFLEKIPMYLNQWCYSSVDRVLGWGARGPRLHSQEGRNFFRINLFLRGNEPNSEQEQEEQQQQLK